MSSDKNPKEDVREENSPEQSIPEMELDRKYSDKKQIMPEGTEKIQKDMDKAKKELEKLKSSILKKYGFTQVLSILPPQAIKFFIEEEEVPKETEKYIILVLVLR